MLRLRLNTEIGLKRMRLFLLCFVLHFFVLQPILNVCFPELVERVAAVQDIEENEEEEDALDRTFEEEILHSAHHHFSFDQSELPFQKTNFVLYFYQHYFCAKADVHTPPPELILG